jgi:Cu-Zn family superoxide dismutase
MKTQKIILAGLFLVTGLSLQLMAQGTMHGMDRTVPPVQKAICILYPTEGNTAHGTVSFTRVDGGIHVVADLQGLSKGKHGFHIHEFGDCSAPDGTSAGGHFNPEGKTHASPAEMDRHMGDMGNIEADEAGKARLDYIDRMMTLDGEHSIIGRSVILHKNEDDLKTQPTGNAGPRIACGVIGVAK